MIISHLLFLVQDDTGVSPNEAISTWFILHYVGKCCRWGNGDIYLSQMGYREFQIQLLIQVGEEQDYTMIYVQILEGT